MEKPLPGLITSGKQGSKGRYSPANFEITKCYVAEKSK